MRILEAKPSERSSENEVLRVLNSRPSDYPGLAFIPALLNNSIMNGPNGRHLCIVTEVAGRSFVRSRRDQITWEVPSQYGRVHSRATYTRT